MTSQQDYTALLGKINKELPLKTINGQSFAFTGASLIDFLKQNGEADPDIVAQALLTQKHIKGISSKSQDDKFLANQGYIFAKPRRVVIVGGGYAGAALAKKYDAAMKANKHLNMELVLVDDKAYFHNFVLVPFIWNNQDKAQAFMKDHSTYLSASGKVKIVASRAKSITAAEVECENGTIINDFEALVISTGSRYNLQSVQQTKNDNSTEQPSVIIQGNQIPHIIQYKDTVASADHITFIGGGVTTIEVVTSLLAKYPKKQYTIVTSADRLLSHRDVKVHNHQAARFQKLYKNVQIILKERVTTIDHNEVVLATSGKKIKSQVVILCNGFTPNTECIAAGAQKDPTNAIPLNAANNLVVVNKHLQTVKHAHVFAIGDVADTGVERRLMAIKDQSPVLEANLNAILNNGSKLQAYKGFGDKKQEKLPLMIGNGPSFGTMAGPNDSFVYGSFLFAPMKLMVEKLMFANYV